MKLFDVYPLNNILPVEGKGSVLWDEKGKEYLDLYGGHAVISIGHSHPHYVKSLQDQIVKLGFYSNSVINPLQHKLAEKIAEVSGYPEHSLFLCNSGAEANENALKLASFYNGRKKIIAFEGSFHGRTSLAVAATHDPSIQAPVNTVHDIVFLKLNDAGAFEKEMNKEVAAVIIEGIQGVGGIRMPDPEFLRSIRKRCDEYGSVLILDEVQSGYGRTGKFFAHDGTGIKADIITMAKGMGNGFPVAGLLIGPNFKSRYGMLGTTFGGNHLACTAAIAVLDVLKEESLIENAEKMGTYWMNALRSVPGIKEVRGKGLMIGLEFEMPIAGIKQELFENYAMLVGTSSSKYVLRLLPALNIKKADIDKFTRALNSIMHKQLISVEK